MRGAGEILVVSCYELGHQPLAAASLTAFLERAGYRPAVVDLAIDPLDRLDPELVRRARLIAISVPMHTALHIGVGAAVVLRKSNPGAHVCFYGLYATLNADSLLDGPADSVIGGEFEQPLVELAAALEQGAALTRAAGAHLARLDFTPPSRDALPPPERYAHLLVGGESRTAAAVETSRGCKYRCRHCSIPSLYDGRFFVVPRDVVLADIRGLAGRGVRHITFADPDFLNGPGHAMPIVRAMHEEFPELTFDITTKVEHVVKHAELFEELGACGCLFLVTAVESLSDEVLGHLAKGHTRADVFQALEILRSAGIAMRPSLVAFTPWTSLEDYLEVLEWVEREQLTGHVDPVQLSIRLLVPPGSLLLDHHAMQPHLGEIDAGNFQHSWAHPDPRMDRLHGEVVAIVRESAETGEEPARTFVKIRDAALAMAGRSVPTTMLPARAGAAPPRLTEPWFC